VLFAVGLVGIAYEAIRGGTEQPTLILVFATMMGLPLYLKKDEIEQKPDDEPTPDETPEPPSPHPHPHPSPRPPRGS
jgi:hypothetical protein